jgi:hypothetical protein
MRLIAGKAPIVGAISTLQGSLHLSMANLVKAHSQNRFAKLISRINRRISIGSVGRPRRDRDSNDSTAG